MHKFENQDLLSIDLHPNYAKKQVFVTGGRKQELLLKSIGMWRTTNKIIHSGEGPIYCISWKSELIAWANDRGVKIYDISDHKPIAHINRSKRGSPDPEKYRCHLCWENKQTLLIGWGDWVKIGKVRTVKTQQGHWMKEVLVTNVFITDFYICGIAPFRKHLLLLAFHGNNNNDDGSSSEEEEEDEKDDDFDAGIGTSKAPELFILSRRGDKIATDAVQVNKYRANQASDYGLVWSHDDIDSSIATNSSTYDPWREFNSAKQTYYIVSPKDIIAGIPSTVEDHIKWLWDKEKYEQAWRYSVTHKDDLLNSELDPTNLREEYLKYLLDKKEYDKFSDVISEHCAKDESLWEEWIKLLAEKEKIYLIIDKVPVLNKNTECITDPILNKESYGLILQELIKNDHTKFLECIKNWCSWLYDIESVITSVTNELHDVKRSEPLEQALDELYKLINNENELEEKEPGNVLMEEKKNDNDDDNKCQMEFERFLSASIPKGIEKYLDKFKENELNDIRYVHLFDEGQLENLEMNEIDKKLFMKCVNEYILDYNKFSNALNELEMKEKYHKLLGNKGISSLWSYHHHIKSVNDISNLINNEKDATLIWNKFGIFDEEQQVEGE